MLRDQIYMRVHLWLRTSVIICLGDFLLSRLYTSWKPSLANPFTNYLTTFVESAQVNCPPLLLLCVWTKARVWIMKAAQPAALH